MNTAVVDGSSSMAVCSLVFHRHRKPSLFSRPASLNSLALPFPFHISFNLRRQRGRPLSRGKSHRQKPSSEAVEFSISLEDISACTTANLERIFCSSKAKVHRFFSSGAEAYKDLKHSIRVERGNRIVFSCRWSSLEFAWNLFLCSGIIVLASKILLRLWSLRHKWVIGGWWVIRRDRSLGGREVVVGRRDGMREPLWRGCKSSVHFVSPVAGNGVRVGEALTMMEKKDKRGELPKWWPDSMPSRVTLFRNGKAQRDADKLVKAIMDNRMSGMDYKGDDIMQLREICRSSGAKVSFETMNACNSFFRAAADFVFDISSRIRQPVTSAYINGEEVRHFLCGLADDIRLDNHRAATLICAAVAARTRSCVLQTWAFELQGKRSKAFEELSNLCGIYQIFPPEENSPDVEMVANSLKDSLTIEQRSHLLSLFSEVCSSGSLKIAAEALGLASNASV